MKEKSFAQIVVDLPVDGPFDYAVDEQFHDRIEIGSRVLVVFANREVIGFVIGFCELSEMGKTSEILSVLDQKPLFNDEILGFMSWFSDYYGFSMGQSVFTFLPNILKRQVKKPCVIPEYERKNFSKKQSKPVLVVDESRDSRWEFIQKKIQETLSKNASVLILVPEIKQAYDLSRKFLSLTKRVVVLDQKATEKEKLDQWCRLHAFENGIVVGTRSAVFSPIQDLGLVIVNDEEHDFYKEEQSPFFHVRETILKRQEFDGFDLVFMTSCPSVNVWHLAKTNQWPVQVLKDSKPCDLQVIDLSNFTTHQAEHLSLPLIQTVESFLEQKKKILLFFNRRGYSAVTHCPTCDENVICPRCDVSLTYSYEDKQLICRLCQHKEIVPEKCPKCGDKYLRQFGRGIEKMVRDLKKFFKSANIERFDGGVKDFPKNADIVVATSSVIYETDMVRPSLTAVIHLDGELSRPDFNASQKTFSTLIALRQMTKEKLIVQTHMPDASCLKVLNKMDYKSFYDEEFELRRDLNLPPMIKMIKVVLRSPELAKVQESANQLYDVLKFQKMKDMEIQEAQPDFRPKWRGKYRYAILLKGSDVEGMMSILKPAIKPFRKGKMIVTVEVM